MRKIFRPFYCIKHVCDVIQVNPTRFLIYGVIVVVFVIEVLVYYSRTFSWHSIGCKNNKDCTRILLVADPQLIGLHNEQIGFITPISIWDSDRYLAITYSYAFKFTKPDMVIFLGDLFDEGSSATDSEFQQYHGRLFNIFVKKQHTSTNYIWLPGDNDIGGEGNDWITENKVKRYENIFQQPNVISVKNVSFYKVNELTSSIPEVRELSDNNINGIRIGLSHTPLLSRGTVFVEKVLQTLKPQLFFTAHTHELMILKLTDEFHVKYLVGHEQYSKNRIYRYDLGINNSVYDISVPTCSYRMGTDKIGYGFAVIENGAVHYTVLWSPDRIFQLRSYEVMIVSFIFIYVISVGRNCSSVAASRRHFQQI